MRRQVELGVSVSDGQRKMIMNEIAHYFETEKGEELTIFELEGLADLFIDTLGPILYNRALDEAMYWFKSVMGNVESDYYSLYKKEK